MAWKSMKLNKIGNIFSGNSINAKTKKEKYLDIPEGTPYVATKDVSYNSVIDYDNGIKIPNSDLDKFRKAHKNSILICAEGGSAGRKLAFNTKDICFVNKLFALEPFDFMDPRYVFYFYHTSDFQEQFKSRMTGLIGGVSMGKFKDIDIPVPPLPIQKKIVEVLDSAFEKIAKAKENSEQNLKNAKEVFESYLQKVFENKGEDWEEKKFNEICEKITDGTHQTPTYFSEGVIFLSSKNVTSGKIDWNNIRYIDQKQHEEMQKRVSPQLNDILLAKNGTTGVAAIVDKDEIFDIYVSLALLRPKENINPLFLLYFINSPIAKKQFNKRLKGIGVPNLHLQEIREVEISFPKSLEKQKTIVSKLDNLSTQTKQLEQIYSKKLSCLEELKQSILQKAFKGELTKDIEVSS
jgi:type I restriction enzyme, S subunit